MGTVKSPTDPNRVFEDDDAVGPVRPIGAGGRDPDLSLLPPGVGPKQGLMTNLMGLFGFGKKPTPLSDFGLDMPGEGMDASNWFEQTFSLSGKRTDRYSVYEEMDTFDLPRSVLDAYAEEATQADRMTGQAFSISTNDTEIKKAYKQMAEAIKLEDRATQLARNTAKFGDDFHRLIYSGGEGIQGMQRRKPEDLTRTEDKFGRLVGFSERGQTYRGDRKHAVSWPWDYSHYRLLGGDDDVYGTSLLTGWFRPWRQMTLAEDATLIYRLRRAPDRNMIMVDVGDMDPVDQAAWMNRWKKF